MKTKAITTTKIMTALFLLTVLFAFLIPTVKAEEYSRINFQVFAKGPGRLSFNSGSTGLYYESFDESMLAIAGTSGIEDMGSWYRLKEGTVKIGGSIKVGWTHSDGNEITKYELHLIPKVGKETSGYISWAFIIDHMGYKCICKINDEVQDVSEGYMVINLLTTPWLNQITVTLDITVEGEPAVIVLYWYDYSADVFRINTKLV